MIKKYFLTSLIIVLTLFGSCKKDEIDSDFNESLNAWQAFKVAVNNNYEYSVTTNSWTGHQTETVLTIKDGKVSQRAYTSKAKDGNTGAITVKEQWVEVAGELNSHQPGASILTLDEVYERVRNQWLKAGNAILENNNQGMLSNAGYVPQGCVDDCFVGIKIGFIREIAN